MHAERERERERGRRRERGERRGGGEERERNTKPNVHGYCAMLICFHFQLKHLSTHAHAHAHAGIVDRLDMCRYCSETTHAHVVLVLTRVLCVCSVSYSGQCFSSEAWGGRSANRGQCAQACRMPYGLVSYTLSLSLILTTPAALFFTIRW
jgi:hypothetical protein